MWIYYCDGLVSYESSKDHVYVNDEVGFDHIPTEEELISVFPEYLQKKAERDNEIATIDRSEAYRNESDPIFFKWQRGEATQQEWLDKVNEIKQRYPKVE